MTVEQANWSWMPMGESGGRVDVWRHNVHPLEIEIHPPKGVRRRFDLPMDQWIILLRRLDSQREDERILRTMSNAHQAEAFVQECFNVWNTADSRLESLLNELHCAGYRFPNISETVSLTAAAPMAMAERLIFAIYQGGELHMPDTGLVTSPSEIADILQGYGFLLEDIVLVLDSMARFQPTRGDDQNGPYPEVLRRNIPIGLRQGPDGISEAFAPVLPGCLVNGKSLGEVLSRIQTRVNEVLDQLLVNGDCLPGQLDLNMARQRLEYQDARFFTWAVEMTS